jgi:hypothetical protein
MPDDMNRTVRLIAVASRDGFSFDDKRYEIGPDGCVDVPGRAVTSLCQHGAFVVAPVQPDDAAANEVAAAFDTDPEV